MERRLFYAIYLVAVTAIWLHVLFPSRALRDFAIKAAAGFVPGLSLAVGQVNFNLPLGVSFGDVTVQYRDAQLSRLERLRLRPEWKTLLPGWAAFSFQTEIGGGKVRGRVAIETAPVLCLKSLHLELETLQMAAFPVIFRQIGREASGLCSGEVVWDSDRPGAVLEAHLSLENGRIEIRHPLIKRRSLSFAKIDAEIDMRGPSLSLRRMVWQGPEIDGEFSGTLQVRSPLEASQIEIGGELRPHPIFLTELRQTIPERLMPQPDPGGRYGVLFTGTVAKPKYRLR